MAARLLRAGGGLAGHIRQLGSASTASRSRMNPQNARRLQSPGRSLAAAAGSNGDQSSDRPRSSSASSELLANILSGVLAPYWERTPSAEGAIGLLEEALPQACVAFDHLAFRSFGLPSLGISALAQPLIELGYEPRGDLEFPAKKLRARWYSPPDPELPRLFISEIKVEELSPGAQDVIRQYAGDARQAAMQGRHALLTSCLGVLPWETPSKDDFELLSQEGEAGQYAAWVLTNGFQVNHTTVSVHNLEGLDGGIEEVNRRLAAAGFLLNEAGGVTKVSPDGLLLQSSTLADRVPFTFCNGETEMVPGSYIEFAERRVLPQFESLPAEEVREHHRRDGFEVGSADKIFESTN